MLICLDAGHNNKELNCSPDRSFYEKDFNLDMVYRIKPLLEINGFETLLTRTGDAPVYSGGYSAARSLQARCDISNGANADMFISVHANAAAGSGWHSAQGFDVFYGSSSDTESKLLAEGVIAQFEAVGAAPHGSALRIEAFKVLRDTDATSVLIEYGFYDNRANLALLQDVTWRGMMAEATAKAVCEYFDVEYSTGVTSGGTEGGVIIEPNTGPTYASRSVTVTVVDNYPSAGANGVAGQSGCVVVYYDK